MNRIAIVVAVLILSLAVVWILSKQKPEAIGGTGLPTITKPVTTTKPASVDPQLESQVYDTIERELEESIANITDQDVEDVLLNQRF